MTKVLVVNKDSRPLMPTTPRKARKLLEEGRAKVYARRPFTIQLLYACRGYTQPVTLGIDSGYQTVGYSAVTEKEEVIGGEFKLLEGMSERITERRKYRRTRRNRLRHRKPRFDNRKRKDNWLAPSIQHKFDSHIKLVKRIKSRLPVTRVAVETAKFDIQRIKDSEIQGSQYQQGEQYAWKNVSSYVRHRDGYKCQNPNCKNKSKQKILQVHHLGFWKLPHDRSNKPANLLALCSKCHTPANHKKGKFLFGWEPKLKSFKAETFMTIVYRKLIETLGASETYGYITEADRESLGLPKTHNNDAFVIAGGTTQVRCQPLNLEQTRRNRRSLEQFYDAKYLDIRTGKKATGSTLFSGRRTRNKNLNDENLRAYRGQIVSIGRRSIRKSRYLYQQNDLVIFDGNVYRVRGMQNRGTRVALYADKNLTADVRKIQPYLWRKGICEQLTS
ncbi:RNA-guided endonuclease IscB [Coleofasciculus sp. G2-EDA-02]|uniref:RNA-guided endonuclease IscB n=1 Tax=Coleofasciculus sp. G2-EDA-02 TaxID=3069529 RepID=UPI0033050284